MAAASDPTDSWLNFQLICKPEQSGKTFIMIQQIIKDMEYPIDDKIIINIIFCDQSLLLVKQTSVRVEDELKEYTDGETIYVELSSSKRAECHNNAEVFKKVASDNVQNIICCTNSKRMDDIYELIQDLNNGHNIKHNFHFNIWLDEADKFIKFIDSVLIPIVDNNSNVNVKLITATPSTLFKKYHYLNVFPIENTTSDEYHGWNDNIIKLINEKSDNYLEYIEHILSDICPDYIKNETKWFIPGMHNKKSHYNITELCITKGMAVICVNGDGIKLTTPDLKFYNYEKIEELKNTIQRIYTEHKLSRYPVVITGNICISRGISIQNEEFMIDYAILSQYSNKNEASQLAGRTKGNIKKYKNYKKPIVFTTDDFNSIACEWEEKSKNLAKLSFTKEQSGLLTIITKNEYNTCDKKYKYIIHPELFNSFMECKVFLNRIDIKKRMDLKKGVSTNDKIKPIHLVNGYAITSKLLKNGQTKEDLTKEMRLTLRDAGMIEAGRCISSTDKGSCYLILPVYDSLDTPANKEKYQVRYIDFS